MTNLVPNRWRLTSAVADVLLEPAHGARLDTQILFGEEAIFLEHSANGFTKVRTFVDHKVGWVADTLLHFKKAGSDPITHRVSKPCALVYSAPDYKERVKGVLSMNSRVTVTSFETRGEREYAEIQDFMGDPVWVRASSLCPVGQQAPDFVAVAESFIGRQYGWGRRDANPGIDCSAIVLAAILATGRKSCARDSGEQAKSVGERVELASLRDLRRGHFVFMPGHVVVMTDSVHCVHATERDPYNGVVRQPLEQVLQERRAAGDSCDLTIRWFPQYHRQQLRRVA